MSRLAPALRMRRRQLDDLRFAIAVEQQRASALSKEASILTERQRAERALTSPVSADAWFAISSRRVEALTEAGTESEVRLSALRSAAVEARARLSLLEEAEAAARRAERRTRDKAAQATLDDRTASTWGRR